MVIQILFLRWAPEGLHAAAAKYAEGDLWPGQHQGLESYLDSLEKAKIVSYEKMDFSLVNGVGPLSVDANDDTARLIRVDFHSAGDHHARSPSSRERSATPIMKPP